MATPKLDKARTLSQEFTRLSPPIIIIGMHRSGTSLVAGLLHILGVYLDPAMIPEDGSTDLQNPTAITRQAGYGEATAFRLLNEAMMEPYGAVWDNPLPFLTVRDNPKTHQQSLKRIYEASHTTLQTDYLVHLPKSVSGRWGWKDPRTSLTLPYWLEVFPKSHLLYVSREAEGVVKSLLNRANAVAEEPTAPVSTLTRLSNLAKNPRKLIHAIERRLGYGSRAIPTLSMQSREDCIRLTEIYVSECVRYRDSRYTYSEISYEAMIANPEAAVHHLIQIFGLTPSPEAVAKAIRFISRP